MDNKTVKNIVIVGGGFGGLNAALALRKAPVKVTLIDKRNFHLFQPLLYQVASGSLSPADIAYPLRALFKKNRNVRIMMGEAMDVDLNSKRVQLENRFVKYDYLIIAAGAGNHYFGNDEWEKIAPGLKTIEDATAIRSRILSAFEKAELETDPEKKRTMLTFAIVGGGPAGVEMAGAIADISRFTLRCDFRNINPSLARILLIEGDERILPGYSPELSAAAKNTLQRLGVEVINGTIVKEIKKSCIMLDTGNGDREIPVGTTIWAAGVRTVPLADMLIGKYDLPADNCGRIIVESDCTIPGFPTVYVIGDMACFRSETGEILPGVAPAAIQQGRFAARAILSQLSGGRKRSFQYRDKGSLAVIGRKSAVGFRKNIKVTGILAWLTWLFVHLLYLVGFENRLLVATQWAFSYFSFNRSARLITNTVKKD